MGGRRRWIVVNVVGVCLLLLVFGGMVGPDQSRGGLGPRDNGQVSGVVLVRRARVLLQSRRVLQQTDRTFARERRRWDAEALQNVGVPVILGRGFSAEDRVLHFRGRGISDFFEAVPEWPESGGFQEPENKVGLEESKDGDPDQALGGKRVGEAESEEIGHKGLEKGRPGSVPDLVIRDSDSEVGTSESFDPVQTVDVNVTASSTGGAASSSSLETKGSVLGQGLPLNLTGGVATNGSSKAAAGFNQSEFGSRDPDFDAHPHILQNVTEAERVERTTAESEPLTKGAPGEAIDRDQGLGLGLEKTETSAPTQPPEESDFQNPFADPETAPMLILPPQRSIKVYIYDLPPHLNRDFMTRDPRVRQTMFATEVLIHENFEQSAVRTLDPEEADFYFIPVYTAAVLEDSGRTIPDTSYSTMLEAVMYVVEKWPYFNRMRGLDHVVVAPHDYGACFQYRDELASQTKFRMVLRYLTVLQTFGVHNHVCYRPGRSVVIPPYIDVRKLRQLAFAPERDAHEKSVLAFFRGLYIDAGNDATGKVYSRGVRLAIGQTFANHPDFDISDKPSPTYLQDMMRATFCLCPLGWAPWSPRIFESVQIGCIPVIIADDIILPFENYFNWERIAVRVKEADVPRLEEILKGIPPEKVAAMQKAMWDPQVRQALIFPEPAEPGDAFEMILSELEAKVERIRHKRAEYFRKYGQ